MNDLYSLSSSSDEFKNPSFHSGSMQLEMRMHSGAAGRAEY